MYNSFFHLREAPFSITPDPRFLFMSQRHQEALAHLLYGTGEEGGFVQLTGEVGTGKTTLVRALLESQLEQVDIALILNPRLTAQEFVASICDELGVGYPADATTLKPLIDALNHFLLRNHSEGRQAVLIVDEAQNLDTGVLEQVRLLTNLETSRHKLLRIILVGQPELQNVLARHDMRQLAQRITARYHLDPLDRSDVAGYVAHRLGVAGGDPGLFTPGALREIHRRSGGVPRLINVICDRSLLGAYAAGVRAIPAAMVKQAAREAMGPKSTLALGHGGLAITIGATLAVLSGIGLYLHLAQPVATPEQTLAAVEEDSDQAPQTLTAPEGQTELPEPQSVERDEPILAVQQESTEVSESPPTGLGKPALTPRADPAATTPEQPAVAAADGEPEAMAEAGEQDKAGDSGSLPADPEETLAATHPKSEEPAAEDPRVQLSALLLGAAPFDFGDAAMMPVVEDLPVAMVENTGTVTKPFDQLYALWGETLTDEESRDPCTSAPGRAMHCLEGEFGWDELQSWNRPAILELEGHDGKPRSVLLRALPQPLAVVDMGEGLRRVHVDQLRALWTGKAAVLWRPRIEAVLLRQGARGEPVLWLRRQLDISEGANPSERYDSDRFDEALERRVRRFQTDQGLVQDGVVGPRTMLILNNLAPAADVPTLVPGVPGFTG